MPSWAYALQLFCCHWRSIKEGLLLFGKVKKKRVFRLRCRCTVLRIKGFVSERTEAGELNWEESEQWQEAPGCTPYGGSLRDGWPCLRGSSSARPPAILRKAECCRTKSVAWRYIMHDAAQMPSYGIFVVVWACSNIVAEVLFLWLWDWVRTTWNWSLGPCLRVSSLMWSWPGDRPTYSWGSHYCGFRNRGLGFLHLHVFELCLCVNLLPLLMLWSAMHTVEGKLWYFERKYCCNSINLLCV